MSILATQGSVVGISPDTVAVHAADVLAQSTINKVGTLVASSELNDRAVARIPYWDSVDALQFVDEAGPIPESGTGLQELQVPTRKLATIRAASNETMRATAGASVPDLLMTHITDSLTASADAAVFGDATDGTLTGLGALPGVTATELGDNLDAFTDAFLHVIAEGGTEDEISVVAHPAMWAHVTRIKEKTGSGRPLLDAVTGSTAVALPNPSQLSGPSEAVTRTVYGRPVWLSRHIAADGIYVLDRRNVVVAAEPMRIDRSEHSKFRNDATEFRGTLRIGWKVHRPERVTRITLPASGA